MAFKVVRNNLLKMKVDAIVNPTDYNLSGSGSIDGKLHYLGKEALRAECDKYGHCDFGGAILTNAYGINAKYIIHTVGPFWDGNPKAFDVLTSCYVNCLTLAKQLKLKSIAFPLIASGSFGFPKAKAISIATNTISSFILDEEDRNEEFDMDIYLVVYSAAAVAKTKMIFGDIKVEIEDDQVEEPMVFTREEKIDFYNQHEIPIIPDYDNIKVNSEFIDEIILGSENSNNSSMTISGEEKKPRRKKKIKKNYDPNLISDLLKKEKSPFGLIVSQIAYAIDEKVSNIFRDLASSSSFHNWSKGADPERRTALLICFRLPITIDEANDILSRAGFCFNPYDREEKYIYDKIANRMITSFELNNPQFLFCEMYDLKMNRISNYFSNKKV